MGICGSDAHQFSEGHIGPGVTGWAAGDRAALEPAVYCYHCEFCLSGRHNICSRIRFLSNSPTQASSASW